MWAVVGFPLPVGYWVAFSVYMLDSVAYDLRWLPVLEGFWTLFPVSVESVQIFLGVSMGTTQIVCGVFFADLYTNRNSGAWLRRSTEVSLAGWGTVLLVAVVASVMGAANLWMKVMYVQSTYDVDSRTINLRGVAPKPWSMPVLVLLCGVLVSVGLSYTNRARRPLWKHLWKLYVVVAIIVYVAGFLQRLPAHGSALSMYTGVGVGQVLALISATWSVGLWLFILYMLPLSGNKAVASGVATRITDEVR